jgi:Sucrose synthase
LWVQQQKIRAAAVDLGFESIGPPLRLVHHQDACFRLIFRKSDFLGAWLRRLFDFLSTLKYNGQNLMLNERVRGVEEMVQALNRADRFLDHIDDKVLHLFMQLSTCCKVEGCLFVYIVPCRQSLLWC